MLGGAGFKCWGGAGFIWRGDGFKCWGGAGFKCWGGAGLEGLGGAGFILKGAGFIWRVAGFIWGRAGTVPNRELACEKFIPNILIVRCLLYHVVTTVRNFDYEEAKIFVMLVNSYPGV